MQDSPDLPGIPPEKVEALRHELSAFFAVWDTAIDQPHPGYVRFRGRFVAETADCYDELRHRFEQHGFTPMIREENGRTLVIALPTVFNPPASNWIINLVLFLLTIFSTLSVGAILETADRGLDTVLPIWQGWPFSFSILLILGAHELGHYFAARYHKVPVTLPYFIPLPFISLIGTLGAFIQLKAPVKNRRALLDVGIAGPFAGFLFAVPLLAYGLATSTIQTPTPGSIFEGNSILYLVIKFLIFGRILPGDGVDVTLNPIAWAGWVGLLVTGLNLIPLGQLDGGHMAYVLWGKQARQLFWPMLIGLSGLAIVSGNSFWIIWIFLLYFLGQTHAEPLDDVTPLDSRRRFVAILALVLFVLVFVPFPLMEI